MNKLPKPHPQYEREYPERVDFESERKGFQEIRYFPNPRLFNPPDTWNRGFLGANDSTYGSTGFNIYTPENSYPFLAKRVNHEAQTGSINSAAKTGNGLALQKSKHAGFAGDAPSHKKEPMDGVVWQGQDSNSRNSRNTGLLIPVSSVEPPNLTESGKLGLTVEQESTHDGTTEEEGRPPQKIDLLLQNREESEKAILKILLYEVIINEKVNKRRISFLPNQVVELLLLFLKRHYGFCLENATRAGTAQKYLYLLRTEGYELDSEDELLIESFRFRFQLYMYGVKKKIPKNASKLADDYYVTKTLFDQIYPKEKYSEESRGIKLSQFWSLVQMTFSRDSILTLEAIKAWLPKPLLPKLLSFSPELLSKYYGIRLKKYLKELFSGNDLTIALLRQRIKSSPKIPLLSDLLHDPGLKSALERRNYHLGPCLDLG